MRPSIRPLLLLCLLSGISRQALAQDPARPGTTFGFSLGVGQAVRSSLPATPNPTGNDFAVSWRVGYRFTPRVAATVVAGGTVYQWEGAGRRRKRGVEGLFPSLQLWVRPRLWVSAGAGVQFDAPVFYDVRGKVAEERAFHRGAGAIGSVGYVVRRTRFGGLEVQARATRGFADLPQGRQNTTTFAVLLGLAR